MAGKDYYVVLGVPRTETVAGIRAAYRALAKRFHPDHGGDHATHAFQEISEAYEVLSDPARRRAYNQTLRAAQEPAGGPLPTRAAARPRPAPLVSEEPAVSIPSPSESIWPSFEAFEARLLGRFTGMAVPKSERLEGLNMDLLLTADEAARGLVLRLALPTVHRCPACSGSGFDWPFPCGMCDRQVVVQEDEVVRVRVPAGVGTGTVLEAPLRNLGVQNLVLRFHVSVTGTRDPQPLW
jgi:molecular chaperone DnaJ